MTLKVTKIWFFSLLPVVLFFICYYCTQIYFDSCCSNGKSPQPTVSLCDNSTAKKWNTLNLSMSRNTELFLKLKDFIWKKYISTHALPYGIKGSEFMLLKILAMASSYAMPANIERLNNAPVRGFEEDVGNKTTLRLFYPESASPIPEIHNNPDTLLVLVPFKDHDLRWLKMILYNEKRVLKGFWKLPPQIWLGGTSQIRVLDPYFLRLTASNLLKIPLRPNRQQKPVHPTTGILAVFVALNYCDVVHLAGFGYPEARNQQHPIHYYGQDTLKSMKNSNHDLDQEAQVLKRLEEQGLILYLRQS
ncbi:CMP-N-acetylneuraminate-beta-galactosamide-alpha-2,3-sialyltransferase 4 isoform X5 [Misgurnus anguillicaudatus]|uniref:CMP-N-acetylneuraminate-beta-galactosamide- alpha-2,3-sialyltransferase 4 isoform X5 n=1 Tax=Misgurnus anguillicaudatus TaxID=75329 RepID=UPI003CCF5067